MQSMPTHVRREPNGLHPMSTVFPSLLLALTPLFDVVRLITRNPAWSRAALWSALVATVAAVVAVLPELIDWLALDRHTRARRAAIAPLTVHAAAAWPLALGFVERLRDFGATTSAHDVTRGALAVLPRFDAWPFALAIAGTLAWLLGDWMATAPRDRVRYQPTGLPSSA